MAKMFGFEVKNVTNYRGHEGEPLSQGNVYFNGKKLGFWSMGDWGGPANFEFDARPFNKEIAKLAGTKPFEKWVGIEPDLDALLSYLMDVKDDEKLYKKFIKQGSKMVVKCTNGYQAIYYGTGVDSMDVTLSEEIRMQAAKDMKCDADDIKVTVFRDADDFIVGDTLPIDAKVVKGVINEAKEREAKLAAYCEEDF